MTEPDAAIDPCRPLYHYSSGMWMNDVIPYHDGETLHVFFNHNPDAARWGRFRWGHATTTDLVRWTTAPVAMAPTADGPDDMGIWTGCVVPTEDGVAALYTGVSSFEPLTQNQCLAHSADTMTWEKRPDAVLTAPPDGFGPCFRDPSVRWEDGAWRMLIGSTRRDDEVAAVLAYASPDLVDWQLTGALHVAETGDLGREAECPELFRLGGRDVLVTSHGLTRGVVGAVDGTRTFVPDGPAQAFDPGSSYAARSADVDGRRIQVAWLRDTRSRKSGRAAGWLGALSLPRELSLGDDGRLAVAPVSELRRLRTDQVHDGLVPLRPARTVIPGPTTLSFEMTVELEPRPTGRTGVAVGCGPDGSRGLEVVVDWSAGRVAGYDVGPFAPDDPLRLHVFVDRSVVEVFTQGKVITLRNYALAEAPRVALRADGGPTTAHVTAWHLETPMAGL